MFEEVITNALKAYDDEVTDVHIEGKKVSIEYSDGDYYTGEVRIDGTAIVLDFHRTFIIRINLSI